MAGGSEDHPAKTVESPKSAFEGLAAGLSALGQRDSSAASGTPAAYGRRDSTLPGAAAAEHILPGLQEEEHLPWLYSAEDELDAGVDPRRVWAFVLTGFVLLVLIVGGVWWTVHRRDGAAQLADGSLITAPPGPIKEAPQDPGGKTFDGTGDSSFSVSQGRIPAVTLAAGGDHAADAPAAGAAADGADDGAEIASGSTGPAVGGVGVQLGAFSSQLAAEAAWAHLAKAYDALSGSTHRIVEGKADIGTVYRLQAVTGSDAAAAGLCDRLRAAGLNCQVKD